MPVASPSSRSSSLLPPSSPRSPRSTSSSSSSSSLSDLSPEEYRQFRALFSLVDHDSSGTISRYELFSLFRTLNIGVSNEEIDRMMVEADHNDDGQIDFNEFINIISNKVAAVYNTQQVTHAFRTLAASAILPTSTSPLSIFSSNNPSHPSSHPHLHHKHVDHDKDKDKEGKDSNANYENKIDDVDEVIPMEVLEKALQLYGNDGILLPHHIHLMPHTYHPPTHSLTHRNHYRDHDDHHHVMSMTMKMTTSAEDRRKQVREMLDKLPVDEKGLFHYSKVNIHTNNNNNNRSNRQLLLHPS